MIVCSCYGISDRDIQRAIDAGAGSAADVAKACPGAGTDCGSCRAQIAAMLAGEPLFDPPLAHAARAGGSSIGLHRLLKRCSAAPADVGSAGLQFAADSSS